MKKIITVAFFCLIWGSGFGQYMSGVHILIKTHDVGIPPKAKMVIIYKTADGLLLASGTIDIDSGIAANSTFPHCMLPKNDSATRQTLDGSKIIITYCPPDSDNQTVKFDLDLFICFGHHNIQTYSSQNISLSKFKPTIQTTAKD